MTLPSKEYFTVFEAEARWGVPLATIAGWAEAGRFRLVTSTPLVVCGAQKVCGMVELCGSDLFKMLGTAGVPARTCLVHRVIPLRKKGAELLYVTCPRQGLAVQPDELWIPATDLYRFEEKHALGQCSGRSGNRGGREPKYDWEGMWAPLCVHLFTQGVPNTLNELASAMQDWFIEVSPAGEAPDMSTIRRRIQPLWQALKTAREN
ncbi:hypothetical protein PsAD13_01432 [Pseudovibrio sp. Ad13]|uniref:hypothetical protein n=1 Tax=Pseudovibrio sp. Ad13 TaxID=989396 RepID=UPI0007AE7A37|nr:hypothetical protein [Pseudovibrio sp. Ad13]KZK84898.1 hypothetical protein PsAD13_01432 [Pseudovibrio sp. Ad13]